MAVERSAERDAAIAAMLPHVPFDGWTRRALRAGLADIGMAREDAEQLPGSADISGVLRPGRPQDRRCRRSGPGTAAPPVRAPSRCGGAEL
jgi:ubiquinone biosynthesis protein COQ9